MRGFATCSVLFASLALSSAASAQSTSQPLLDDRALGMGGAITGSARGPTAAFYNPGGLADTGRSSVGASLALRSFRDYEIQDAYVSQLGIEDLNDTGFFDSTVMLGGALAFGDRDRTGMKQHALSAGTLLRSITDRSFRDSFDTDDTATSTLEVLSEGSDRWFFIGYAARPLPELSLGITVAVSARSESYVERSTEGVRLDSDAAASLAARNVEIDLNREGLVLRGGVMARPAPWLQLGLVIQSPSIDMTGGGRAVFRRTASVAGEGDLFFREYDSSFDEERERRGPLSPNLATPWQARVGAYVRPLPTWGIAADVGITGDRGNVNDPVLPLGRTVPLDGDRPGSNYFAEERISGVGLDLALGTEVLVTPEMPIRAGVFFEHDANRRADGPRERYAPDQLDRIGATLGVGVHGDRFDFSVGAAYTHGWGTGLRPEFFGSGSDPFLPTTVTTHEITVVFSGLTSAAAEIALDIYHGIGGGDDDEDDDEDGETDAPSTVDEVNVEAETDELVQSAEEEDVRGEANETDPEAAPAEVTPEAETDEPEVDASRDDSEAEPADDDEAP